MRRGNVLFRILLIKISCAHFGCSFVTQFKFQAFMICCWFHAFLLTPIQVFRLRVDSMLGGLLRCLYICMYTYGRRHEEETRQCFQGLNKCSKIAQDARKRAQGGALFRTLAFYSGRRRFIQDTAGSCSTVLFY